MCTSIQSTFLVRADFVIISGDLIRDALRVNENTARNYYEMFVAEINQFKMPVYCGLGNHELFGIERDKSLVSVNHPLYGKKMYQHYLGPNYYAFNYGGMHFISIDAMNYQDTYYFGGVDSVQLQWLENELQHVPSTTPVVTFNHIPFISPGFSFQDFEEDKFYGPQLLRQGNKQYHRHIVYNSKEVITRIGQRPYPLALSGHYHAAQDSKIIGSTTVFAQTSAIAGPDVLNYYGFTVQSGFTLYEVNNTKIISSKFIPLNMK
jgi:predicted MPP superfamily phosphohydrolase